MTKLAKKVETVDAGEPAALALKMQSLFVEQAEKLNSIHDYLQTVKQASDEQRIELAKTNSKLQKLIDDTLTYRQVIEEVKTLARDGLALERQRLAKERDLDHQQKLGRIVETPRGTHGSDLMTKMDIAAIFERLDKIDEGLREQGRLITKSDGSDKRSFETHGLNAEAPKAGG
jgi:hypothetical protein